MHRKTTAVCSPSAPLVEVPLCSLQGSGLETNTGANFLLSGQIVSVIGSQFSLLAVQMIAVTALRANPIQMGLLAASQTFPYLALSLFVGVLIDRLPKRSLLMLSDIARALILITATALLIAGRMTFPLLYGLVSVIAIFNLLFDASLGALIPALFAGRRREGINSKVNSAVAAGDVIGPSISGYALKLFGVSGALFFDAISYLVSAACILRGVPPKTQCDDERASRQPIPILPSIVDGATFVFRNRVLRILGLGSGIWNFSWSAVTSILVLHAIHDLQLTTSQTGLAFATGGVGGIAGSALGWRLSHTFRRGPLLVLTPWVGIAGCAVLLISAPMHPFVLIATALFTYNLGESTFGVNMQTARQAVTPLAYMGRMDTAMRFCFRGMASLGSLAGGLIANYWGFRATVCFGASGLLTTILIFSVSDLWAFGEVALGLQTPAVRNPNT